MSRPGGLVSYRDVSECDCSSFSCPSVAPCLLANSGWRRVFFFMRFTAGRHCKGFVPSCALSNLILDLGFLFRIIRSGERSIRLLSVCSDIGPRYLGALVLLRVEVFCIRCTRFRLFVSGGFRAEVSSPMIRFEIHGLNVRREQKSLGLMICSSTILNSYS